MNGTDEDVFIDIFANRGHSYLNAVYDAYEAEYGNTMESVIESEFDGDMKNLLLDISKWARNPLTWPLTDFSTLFSQLNTAGPKRLTWHSDCIIHWMDLEHMN